MKLVKHQGFNILVLILSVPSIRDAGVVIGPLPTGPTNSLADIAGVGVGHATLVRDEPPSPEGRGAARTGVTVICLAEDAFDRPLPAGGAILNGAGECTGFITSGEWGLIETPILLTSTMQLGRVYDAACELMIEQHAPVGNEVVIPVVGECDDSFLNNAARMQVTRDDVATAWASAYERSRTGEAAEQGSVGSGTGMACLGFKGGIGESSRVTPTGHTVAVLLMTNFGGRDRLTIDGVRIAPHIHPDPYPEEPVPPGSCLGHRRHRRTGRRRELLAACPSNRSRARTHRLGGLPRQRGDLHGRQHRPAFDSTRAATVGDVGRPP